MKKFCFELEKFQPNPRSSNIGLHLRPAARAQLMSQIANQHKSGNKSITYLQSSRSSVEQYIGR